MHERRLPETRRRRPQVGLSRRMQQSEGPPTVVILPTSSGTCRRKTPVAARASAGRIARRAGPSTARSAGSPKHSELPWPHATRRRGPGIAPQEREPQLTRTTNPPPPCRPYPPALVARAARGRFRRTVLRPVRRGPAGASRPTHVPPDLGAIPREDAPAYDDLINFPRARDKELAQCVMCGRRPGQTVHIPRQNKDVCKDCDRQIWQHSKSLIYFKWCKGCKRFLNLSRFGERIGAAKCEKCRHRARQSYMAKKVKAGEHTDGGPKSAAKDSAAAQSDFVPPMPKPGSNLSQAPTLSAPARPGGIAVYADMPPHLLAGAQFALGGPQGAAEAPSAPSGGLPPVPHGAGGGRAGGGGGGGVGSVLLANDEGSGGGGGGGGGGGSDSGLGSSFQNDASWGRSILSRTPRSFNAGSYEISNMKRHRIGSISRRLRSASDLEETGIINRKQKGVLKDLLISGDEQLQAALDKFESGETAALEAIITSGTLDYPSTVDVLDGFELRFENLQTEQAGDYWPQPPLGGEGNAADADASIFAMDDVGQNVGAGAPAAKRQASPVGGLADDPLNIMAGGVRSAGERKGSFASVRRDSFGREALGAANGLGVGSYGASSFGAGMSLGQSYNAAGSFGYGNSLTGDDVQLMQPDEVAANLGPLGSYH